jgi:RNA-directed DNA polymerase
METSSNLSDDFSVPVSWKAESTRPRESGLLADQISLTLSPEKIRITKFKEGFAFLGFQIGAWTIRMRDKSVEKFKVKVRTITTGSHNLDAQMITKLNRVIRGAANYCCRPWSACSDMYRTLDGWIRMRLRCIKTKRKSAKDNHRLRLAHLKHMRLLTLSSFLTPRAGRIRGSP